MWVVLTLQNRSHLQYYAVMNHEAKVDCSEDSRPSKPGPIFRSVARIHTKGRATQQITQHGDCGEVNPDVTDKSPE
jgi:hypothetical protein